MIFIISLQYLSITGQVQILAPSCQQTFTVQPCWPRVERQSLVPVIKGAQSSRGVSEVRDCNTRSQNERRHTPGILGTKDQLLIFAWKSQSSFREEPYTVGS